MDAAYSLKYYSKPETGRTNLVFCRITEDRDELLNHNSFEELD